MTTIKRLKKQQAEHAIWNIFVCRVNERIIDHFDKMFKRKHYKVNNQAA